MEDMSTGFTLRNTDWAAEFARFANFIGPAELHEAVVRVASKLDGFPPSIKALYLDRYFFHSYCATIADGPSAFQLDVTDPNSVRVASFTAGVNRMRLSLSSSGAARFRNAILGLLRPDRDLRQLEHEVRAFTHFGQKTAATTLADLEGLGQFDMLCEANGSAFEVECKTVTEDTGEQIKTDLLVSLSDVFRRTLQNAGPISQSGIYILSFAKSPALCRNLHPEVRNALTSPALPLLSEDFQLRFEPRPDWGGATSSEAVTEELEALSGKWFAARFADKVVGLALRPHKPSSLTDKIIGTLKDAADQCSGTRPSLLWLHLIGHPEKEFLEVAQFSQNGEGAGLNAIVAHVVHPRASTTDRSHVYNIRFSAEPAGMTQRPVLDADLMIRKANSRSGPCYDVPNSLCRFSFDIDA
jgi:hypothetical protein